jgi:uncharacterized YccA/Bax inhibitor family protein
MAKLNPVFSGIRVDEGIENAASVKGVASKTLLLLVVAVLSAIFSITYGAELIYGNIGVYIAVVFGALICGVVGQISPNAAKVCSIIYAVCEGALLGLLSFLFEAAIGGIVMSAVLITATIFGVMLLLYSTNIIKVTGKFIRVMSGIGITILVVSLIYLISSLINPNNILITALYNNTGILLLVSGFTLIYGAFMLALDFENINVIVANGFDKKYEWTASLGLMVTIVWIYVKVLRILAIIASRSRD